MKTTGKVPVLSIFTMWNGCVSASVTGYPGLGDISLKNTVTSSSINIISIISIVYPPLGLHPEKTAMTISWGKSTSGSMQSYCWCREQRWCEADRCIGGVCSALAGAQEDACSKFTRLVGIPLATWHVSSVPVLHSRRPPADNHGSEKMVGKHRW